MTPDPVHVIQSLLMLAGMAVLIPAGVIAGFSIAAERKRAQARNRG